ncbi:glycosyltransferase [Thalassospira australica]|uniref:glycosyltransferase n=1 Tax=Thalassospira australica TaxID=1528106 RepID=UPI0009DE0BC5|nr:glycosyltransferase [Thalassospira australica]
MSVNKQLRIAQVVASTGNGGLERHAYDLSSGLVNNGHDVTFLTTGTLVPRVPVNVEAVELGLDGNRNSPVVLFQLLQALRGGKFDIVHAQGSKAAQMVAKIRWALPSNVKTVGTLHNQKRNVQAFRKLDHAIGVSKALSKDVDRENCSTIYHGLHEVFWSGDATTIKRKGRPVILAVGRLVEAKGFDILLTAWRAVDADLLIVGDGPEKDRLEHQIKELGLEGKVNLLGRSENVAGYMKAVDGVVVSSRREGFSYVVAEALLCRCPVVSTDVPVANEVLDQDLILSIDPDAMSEKLRLLACDIEGWRKQCESAFDFASQEFVYDKMLEKTENLYSKLSGNRH